MHAESTGLLSTVVKPDIWRVWKRSTNAMLWGKRWLSLSLSLSLRNWLGLFDLHLLNLLTDLPPGLILIVWMVDKGWVGGNLVFATLSRVFRISMIIIFPTALYSSGVWARYAWVGIRHTDTLLKPKPQEGSFQTRQFWGMFKHCSGALLYPLQWRLHAFVIGARI